MARVSSRVIARILSTHESKYASLTWEWVMGADGQVRYRLIQLRGRRERNPWQLVTRASGADLHAFIQDTASAEAWLVGQAHEHGHHVDGYPDRVGGAHESHDEWYGVAPGVPEYAAPLWRSGRA